jgi:DUF1680 family protein
LTGWIADYMSAVSEQWLKVAPFSNPAMIEMFRDRDREPKRAMVPWSGYFAWKYLVSAIQVYRVTRDDALRDVLRSVFSELISLQAEDGYVGAWPQESRLTEEAPNVLLDIKIAIELLGRSDVEMTVRRMSELRKSWDPLAHYHAIVALLLWHEETGDTSALAAAMKCGDLLCSVFEHRPMVDFDYDTELEAYGGLNFTEMHQAPIHALCLLYEHTGHARYLQLAEKVRDEFATSDDAGRPLAGDYVNEALSGKEFYELPKPRWESLYPLMGLAELYVITGDETYRHVVERMWWSIVETDRHNNGGFSSGEKAVGNPYDKRPIETCCTIAWVAFGVEMLRLTGESVVADELELSTLNSVTGMHSPNGRWVTYNTPMDGVRRASAHEIVFQAREGSPELNCCSVHGARGFGLISDWAVMETGDGLTLNWYGPGAMSVPLRDSHVTFTQEKEYPRESRVQLAVEVDRPLSFVLRLRIPYWSTNTDVWLNGEALTDVRAGQYLVLDRLWRAGDVIEIEFDFSLQYWAGERECENEASIYRGPILLTYDRRFNTMDPDDVPELDARGLTGSLVAIEQWFPPLLLVEVEATDGRAVRLCDFGSAGVGGSPYRSWLNVKSCSRTDFSRLNPRRSAAGIDAC